MLEILVTIAFLWVGFHALKLMFKVAWCLEKAIAVILLILAFPGLLVCLFVIGGAIILVPLAMVAIAFGLLKSC